MALAEIIQKIEADAQAQAQGILNQAQVQAQAILHQAQAEAQAVHEQIVQQGKSMAAQKKLQELQLAQLEARKEILTEKHQAINQAMELALDKLAQLPPPEYRQLLKGILLALPLAGNEEIIPCAEDASRIGQDFIRQVNDERRKKGLPADLKLAQEQRPCKGGLIVRQGKVELNYSFDAIIRSNQEELEAQLAKILFP